jgi:type II secretion system (T2SS) protein N
MKRAVWITLLAILAFAIILIARMPVSWVAGFIPKNIVCAELAGTVWTGSCTGLVAQGVQVGNVSWDLKVAALLKSKVAGYVELNRGANFVRGDIETTTSGDNITAHDFQADMPLDPALIPKLPPTLRGLVRANLKSIHIEKGTILSVEGLVEAHDLVQGGGNQRYALGDYSLTFPAADPATEPVGQLHSLSGPLVVEGTLKLTREPGYDIQGTVATTPETSPQLAKDLAYLGTPDAQGRRQFGLSGTF